MRPAELHHVPRVRRGRGQVRAGMRYAWSLWELRVPLLMMAVMGTLSYNFTVTLPLFASDVFHSGGGTLGALTTAMGIGALAGALVVASRRRPSYRLLIGVSFVFGVLVLAVSLAPTLPLVLALLVPMGAAGIAFIALANSLLQLHSSGQMRGRVMALWAIVFLGSTPIGAPLTGLVAEHLGARAALGMGAVAALLAALGGALALRRIRREERAEREAGHAVAAGSSPAATAG